MPKGALLYLREQLGEHFLSEYQKLADEDRETLKRWANEEMATLAAA